MNTPVNPAPEDTSVWGYVPRNPIQITNAFSNDPTERPYQDIGLDGMSDTAEQRVRSGYLTQLQTVVSGAPLQAAQADPSSDDYVHYRDPRYDAEGAGILQRYQFYNNTEGNSPVVSTNATYSSAATLYPDNEDLNGDNTMNEDEEYFQYHVDLLPSTSTEMQIGQNFITDKRLVSQTAPNGSVVTTTWYQFRIPVNSYEAKVGNLPDFSSIQFMRMYMTNFLDSLTVLRFGELELVRNQWRTFNYRVDSSGQYDTIPAVNNTTFNVTAVNIEQDDQRQPIPYVIPPGVQRQQVLSTNNVTLLQNEQSMSLQVYDLAAGDSRAVYKTTNLDLRQYKNMQMFLHCEAAQNSALSSGQISAVIRIGQDFVNNYYQITIPLQVTPAGSTIDTAIWPTANNLNLVLQDLVQLKLRRIGPITTLYSEDQPGGVRYSVMGVPNLGQVSGVMIGIQNPANGATISTEVWVDELRLSGLNEKGGYAATGRVDLQLADLGTLSASGSIKTVGWGSIDQNVASRSLSTTTQTDVSTTLELAKLLPKKAHLSVPFFGDYSTTSITPEYDPFDQDVQLKQEFALLKTKAAKDSIKSYAVEKMNITTLNLTNIRKLKANGGGAKLLDLSNFDLSFSFTEQNHHSPTLVEDFMKKYYGGLGYTYNGANKFWQPLKKMKPKNKSKWLDMVRDLNLNYKPNQVLFREDVNRQFAAQRSRDILVPGVTTDTSAYAIPETYNKYFTIAKTYGLGWNISRSLNVNIQALDSARVDEPDGRIDTRSKKDSVWHNFIKGGRNTMWRQTSTATYQLPTQKLPALEWINLTVGYNATYQWNAASLLQEELGLNLGNIIQNTSMRTGKLTFDMKKLYNKLRFFRQLDTLANASPPLNKKDTSAASRLKKPPSLPPPPKMSGLASYEAARIFGRLLTSVKNIGINYSEGYSTVLPGFTDSAVAFGRDWRSNAPGVGFMFGAQPNQQWLNNAAAKGLLTSDTAFNQPLSQTYDQELTGNASLIPIKGMTIELTVTKSFQKNFSELFKDTLGNGAFEALSPYASGGFNVSYIAVKGLFRPFNPNVSSGTFIQFPKFRKNLSERLGEMNPYSQGFFPTGGYSKGYGQYSQDVLVPAFIAAYTGQNPNKVAAVRGSRIPRCARIPSRDTSPCPTGTSRIPG